MLGVCIFIVVVAGLLAGMSMRTPMYRASGLMEIRRESAGTVPVETLFGSERVTHDELETQFGILRSTTLAERVLARVAPPASPAGTDPETPQVTRQAVTRFQKALTVSPKKGSRLVEVSYEARHPETAALMVNAVFDAFLQLRMEEAQRSAAWLDAQLLDAQEQLERAEGELQAYVRQHGIEVLETGKGELGQEVNERLRRLNDSVVNAQADRIQKQSSFEEAAQLASATSPGPVREALSVRLADLRREHAMLLTTFHDEYPQVQAVKNQIVELERALAEEGELALARLEQEHRAAVRREALLRQSLRRQNAVARAVGDNASGYEALKRDVVTSQQLFTLLNQRLKEVSISAALNASNVGIVDRPSPPDAPFNAFGSFNLALAGMVGLFMAAGGMIVREHLDTSVRTVVDVESYLGLPALGAIPAVTLDTTQLAPGTGTGPRGRGPWRRIDGTAHDPSPLAEAFAALRTAVLLNDEVWSPRTLLITSAQSAEGKTTVSINLALSLAALGHRVLLIDANMRFPCVHHALSLQDGPGLVDILRRDVDWRDCRRLDVTPNLDVIACGEEAANPADLLALPRMRDMVSDASREYAYVVIDSPAMLANPADVRSLSAIADSVLLTVRQGTTPRQSVLLALAQLNRVSGVVLNQSHVSDLPAYYRDIANAGQV
jgi:polysaccharide biosynthesis transport protein